MEAGLSTQGNAGRLLALGGLSSHGLGARHRPRGKLPKIQSLEEFRYKKGNGPTESLRD